MYIRGLCSIGTAAVAIGHEFDNRGCRQRRLAAQNAVPAVKRRAMRIVGRHSAISATFRWSTKRSRSPRIYNTGTGQVDSSCITFTRIADRARLATTAGLRPSIAASRAALCGPGPRHHALQRM